MSELHLAEVVVAFGDFKKGARFDFDPAKDTGLEPYFAVGMLVDLGPDSYDDGLSPESYDEPAKKKTVKE